MTILNYIILIGLIFSGGLLAFRYQSYSQKYIPLMLTFSGAYIIGITALHLIPETFQDTKINLGVWLLLGFLGQILIDNLTSGIEHGHMHILAKKNVVGKILFGLCIHSFIEGMSLNIGINTVHNHEHGQLFWGIILHEIPASFALVSLLLLSGFSNKFTIFSLILYTFMSSFGALVTQLFPFSAELSRILMAIIIGTFLHVATAILFEIDNGHKIKLNRLIAIFLGIFVAILTM
jgi:zinc transporter ZupT